MTSILEALSRRPFSVVGHRGAAGVKPENTISSLKFAVDSGADVIEIDVRATKDNVLILLHDESFERLVGIPLKARDLEYRWIKENIRIGGEEIATLEDALRIIGDKANLFIEIKEPDITVDAIDLVKTYGLISRVALISFYDEVLSTVKSAEPRIVTGLIYFKPPGRIFEAKRLGAKIVLPYYRIASSKANAVAHKLGFKVVVWTINDLETAKQMINRGVDAIASDYPDMMVRFRNELR